MKQLFLLFTFSLLWSACGQNENTVQETPAGGDLKGEIVALEKQLLETGDAAKAQDAAKNLVEKTEAFAKANPDAEETPELLFKAADVANGAKRYGKAVQLWGAVWRKHPDHARAPMALFLQGFTFDSKLQDENMARKYYMEFLKNYPDDELAEQIRQLLTAVGQTPEELVKQFEQQGGE